MNLCQCHLGAVSFLWDEIQQIFHQVTLLGSHGSFTAQYL